MKTNTSFFVSVKNPMLLLHFEDAVLGESLVLRGFLPSEFASKLQKKALMSEAHCLKKVTAH